MPYDVKTPPTGRARPRPGELGCWRAHANAWSHIISSGVSSALIFEDDADFSVGIRDIMEGISEQLQDIMGAKHREPYGLVNGNNWDLLTLGNCFNKLPDPKEKPKAAKMIRVWADDYAPESDFSEYSPGTGSGHLRLIGPSIATLCTHGYAVTREGAMRLLYNVGGPGHDLDAPLDMLIAQQLSRGLLRGFHVLPDVVGQWKKGGDWRDTDVQFPSEEQIKSYGKGSGRAIVQSVRAEIEKIFGSRNIWEEIEREADEEQKESEKPKDSEGHGGTDESENESEIEGDKE